jgi:hypothetical protein
MLSVSGYNRSEINFRANSSSTLKRTQITAISNHIRYILAPSSLAGRGLGVGFLFRV